MRASALLVAVVASGAPGCTDVPPLVLEVDRATVAADGVTRAVLTARARDPIDGAVVQFESTGGALSSSSVPLLDGVAHAELIAPLERELGRRSSRALEVTARVVVADGDALEAAVGVTAVPPGDGPPLLFVDASPPAAVAGAGGTVDIAVLSRRVAGGTALSVTSVGASVGDAAPVVDDDGTAHTRVSVPDAAVDARVTVTEPQSGVSASVVVRFVAAGQPLYDLTGAFVQLGPARVKLASGGLTPNPQCAVAPSLILAQFVQTGLDVDASYTTCDVTFPPVTSLVGTITDRATPEFYAAIPVVHQTFSLDTGELGAPYAPPPSVVVVGADLDDPQHDDLPTDEGDPRVVDADDDGAPGVTVQNSLGGDQHIVFRNIGSSKGAVLSSNHILGDEPGDLLATTETSVFGIGGAFLPDTAALGSVVELVRIDGRFGAVDADADGDGEISCAELLDVAGAVSTIEAPETPFDCGSDR